MSHIDTAIRNIEIAEIVAGLVRISLGVAVGFCVHRLARRVPWPGRFRWRFALIHLVTAPAAGLLVFAITGPIEHLLTGKPIEADWSEFVYIGLMVYPVVAGSHYMTEAANRTARAEAAATQMQLSALRAQLQPHFLFNALHTVVQLIPINPARAMEAAELVADLLRATMEDDRDIVSLREEWSFVSRYIELEQIRFGDRLRVHTDVDDALLDVRVPSFALQTLVENAIRHGAAPRVEPTDITVRGTGTGSRVMLSVRNTGAGVSPNAHPQTVGTGLKRLRERLTALHGDAARLTYGPREDGDFEAVVIVPREHEIDS